MRHEDFNTVIVFYNQTYGIHAIPPAAMMSLCSKVLTAIVCVCVDVILRCGEPISGIISKCTRSFGDFRGRRPLGGSTAN